jgi:hypothetical protein
VVAFLAVDDVREPGTHQNLTSDTASIHADRSTEFFEIARAFTQAFLPGAL